MVCVNQRLSAVHSSYNPRSTSPLIILPPRAQYQQLSLCRAASFGYADVSVPELSKTFTFPYRGSGLLFARSTGVKVWEGAYALSRYIARLEPLVESGPDGQHWRDLAVVELGCGLAFVSMTAAHMGAQVLATDGDLDVVNVAKRNMKHNTAECRHIVRAAQLPWGSDHWLAQLKLPGPVDAVLMSDVVYGSDPGVWQKLVHTLKALAGPGTLLLQTETFRLGGRYDAYWEYLQQEGFVVEEVQLDSECNPSGKCRLWRLTAPQAGATGAAEAAGSAETGGTAGAAQRY